jgi:hypothetical protein
VSGRRKHPIASQASGPLTDLVGRLSHLDLQVCQRLLEHEVLTSGLLALLLGTPPRTLQHRLTTLATLKVVERFRPHQPVGAGSAPYHYLLGETGVAILATEHDGSSRAALGWDRGRLLGLAHAKAPDPPAGGQHPARPAHPHRPPPRRDAAGVLVARSPLPRPVGPADLP